MGKIPRRKRFKHVKRKKIHSVHLSPKKLTIQKECSSAGEGAALLPCELENGLQSSIQVDINTVSVEETNPDLESISSCNPINDVLFHDYASPGELSACKRSQFKGYKSSESFSSSTTDLENSSEKKVDEGHTSQFSNGIPLNFMLQSRQNHSKQLQRNSVQVNQVEEVINGIEVADEVELSTPTQPSKDVPLTVLIEVKQKLEAILHSRWIPIIHHKALHIVLLSPHTTLCVQRCVAFKTSGDVELTVHNQSVACDFLVNNVQPAVPLQVHTVNYFVDRCVAIINKLRSMEVCGGLDDKKFKSGWSECQLGVIDTNLFYECRYFETFRSFSCQRLVSGNKWRCDECSKLFGPLKRKAQSVKVNRPSVHTANKYLTEEQKLKKLEEQRRELDCANKKISRLQARMQELLDKEGVQIDQSLSNDLSQILKDSDLSPAQSIFFQQQIKASQQHNMAGMRWHPTMIRLALSIHIISPSAYEMIRDTGMVRLPSSRTLFDYLHVKPTEDGIDKLVLDSVAERVGKFNTRHKKYHALMADEMNVSQNLVFQKSTGRLIGYIKLEEIDEEIKVLEKYLDNTSEEYEPTVATKVLSFMVKGISNGIKGVVATYAVGNLSANQMYIWTWEVIGALERSGVQIVAFICDGSSVNRKFIKKHKPVSEVESKVVFDTINKAAPHRVLYFISDVPHLLKTVRNCFMNSRADGKKGRRKMKKNGKLILWDFIVKLYNLKKSKSLRKAFKLSAINVQPDSYARMKVKYAAEVMSLTVALALEHEGWRDASETINFIRLINNWFDCLNGAHSSIGKKKRNPYLNPYTDPADSRFDFLQSVLDYFEEWKKEAYNLNLTVDSTVAGNITGISSAANISDDSSIEEEGNNGEEDTKCSKRILSYQTLEGIEMSTRAFVNLVKFLLSENTGLFINARVFTQDPLEQHFSKSRAGQGGSNNPNLGQVYNRNRAIHLIGQLGMKRRRGNTQAAHSPVKVTEDLLPKRKKRSIPKFQI